MADLILEGHVAPQELVLHVVVVVEDVEPRRLVPLDGDALVLPLGAIVIVVLELVLDAVRRRRAHVAWR